jgi:hypothetical protein
LTAAKDCGSAPASPTGKPSLSRYRFELATPDDDADLRHVLAATPMAGRIAVSFRREPSWFAGAVVDGRFRQVIACRDLKTGRMIGFGCRSIRDVYINGRPDTIGYLSSLRLLPEHRNLGLVARGYRFFRELHADSRAPFYLTTIAAGNRTALGVLTSGRAGLPLYHPAGAYHTVVISLPRRQRPLAEVSGVKVRSAQARDLPPVLDFLHNAGPGRQFFPRLQADDFLSPDGAMRGLALHDLLLAERGDRLVGTLAGWDQHADRQSVVHAYSSGLHWLRPAYNAWAHVRGIAGLPAPGQAMRYLTAALPLVADDDADVFHALVETVRQRSGGGAPTHLLLGLHETDPLLRVARRFQATCYTTHLFLACWPEGESARAALDDRVPYLEAGSL